MEKQVEKKFMWVTKNLLSLQSEKIYSDQFLFAGGKCRFVVHHKGKNDDYLSLFLEVANFGSLLSPLGRQARFSFTLVNATTQSSEKNAKLDQSHNWCIGDDQNPKMDFHSIHPIGRFKAKNGGFLVNGEVSFVARSGALEVTGFILDVPEEFEETLTNHVKKLNLIDNGAVSSDFHKETMDVNGIQVLRSQVGFVSRLFEKHPDVALEFRSKNPHLRTGYINVLISLTQKLGQSPQELSNDDLSDVGVALTYMTNAGFKMGWLEKTMEEVKEKKKKEEACLAKLHEMEENLEQLKLKCLDLEAQVEKEKAELLEARAPLSFDQYLSS
ncbi:unnamed protein product [Microthlaspi erraticum]|uniref:MATH domain-containing protein n=1 Tax=Microthlaspi erraticum TaxID=1685480 RepID=A0A6D2L7W8_9BRAS|nr:unnamed protein product [Microthlaspi erraticum]